MKKKESWLIPTDYEDDPSQADLVHIRSLSRIPAVFLWCSKHQWRRHVNNNHRRCCLFSLIRLGGIHQNVNASRYLPVKVLLLGATIYCWWTLVKITSNLHVIVLLKDDVTQIDRQYMNSGGSRILEKGTKSKSGCANLLFCKFVAEKFHENERIWNLKRGRASLTPPWIRQW